MKNICNHCGNTLEEGSKFCVHCGAPVDINQDEPMEIVQTEEVEEAKAIKSHTDSFVPKEPTFQKKDTSQANKEGPKIKPIWIIGLIIVVAIIILPKLVGGKKPNPQPVPPVVLDTKTDEPEPEIKIKPQIKEEEKEEEKDQEEKEEVKDQEEKKLGWHSEEDNWYYYDEKGELVKGWLSLDGEDYYLDSLGRRVSGEQEIDGETYIFASSGQLEGKKEATISISSSLYDQDVFYSFLGSDIEERSSLKSYFEIPKFKGPEEIIKKAKTNLYDSYYSGEKERWDNIKRVHSQGKYEDYYGDHSAMGLATRVFETEGVSSVVARLELVFYSDIYGPFYSVFHIDRKSGDIIDSPSQISSFGLDPEKVRKIIVQFMKDNSDLALENLTKEQREGLFYDDWETMYSLEQKYGSGKVVFLNEMADLKNEDAFIFKDKEGAYICFVLKRYIIGEEMYDGVRNYLVRIPLDYSGGRLRELKKLVFFDKDKDAIMDARSKEVFTGLFDCFSYIYE